MSLASIFCNSGGWESRSFWAKMFSFRNRSASFSMAAISPLMSRLVSVTIRSSQSSRRRLPAAAVMARSLMSVGMGEAGRRLARFATFLVCSTWVSVSSDSTRMRGADG